MVQNQENCTQTVGTGAIPFLRNQLETGTDRHKEAAAFALSILTSSEASHDDTVRNKGIELQIPLLKDIHDQKRYSALALGNLAASDASHRSRIANACAIPSLCDLVANGNDV